MPHGWLKLSGNNRRLVEASKRFRERRMTEEELAAAGPDPSVPPPATLDGDVRAADWMGLAWREAAVEQPGRDDVGAYRIGRSARGGGSVLAGSGCPSVLDSCSRSRTT